jgi:thiol-disulfide isomerase/thioredoxin
LKKFQKVISTFKKDNFNETYSQNKTIILYIYSPYCKISEKYIPIITNVFKKLKIKTRGDVIFGKLNGVVNRRLNSDLKKIKTFPSLLILKDYHLNKNVYEDYFGLWSEDAITKYLGFFILYNFNKQNIYMLI